MPARYFDLSDNSTPDSRLEWWAKNQDEPSSEEMKSLVRVRTHAEELESLTTPKGLLVTGPPGAGKTFLVDMWFSQLPTPFKARTHYSQLVLDVYRAVWEETQLRMASPRSEPDIERARWTKSVREHWRGLVKSGAAGISWPRGPNAYTSPTRLPIALVVARKLVLRHWLLVLDELQLLDVSSATLLSDVLSYFWRLGGVLVATSNRVPEDLYRNGVQRERLEPFAAALTARSPVIEMRVEKDWRVVRAEEGIGGTWFADDRREEFDARLKQIVGGTEPASRSLNVFGRQLVVPWVSGSTCKFAFSDLCLESLGPADYLTLASTFSTIAITDIPILKVSDKNQARRFISLIDALYEARCRLLCLAAAPPEQLFFPDAANSKPGREDVDVMMAESVAETQDVYRPNVASYDAPRMEEAPAAPALPLALDTLSIFSGKDEQFAYKRALSRLREMTSARYAEEETWTPLADDARKWERSSAGSKRTPTSSVSRVGTEGEGRDSDFADEAAYERAGDVKARPEAPRIWPRHVWGVEEEEPGSRR
ncbi:hypothetical protein PENSPDRAFT_735877 [Peniophora sp. CONT]|nr:hypothetical protein PENSPDRAFT_735877 [Peniophora sp. CONT]